MFLLYNLLWQLKPTAATWEVIQSNEGKLTDISGSELIFNDAVSEFPLSSFFSKYVAQK
jgi:hypothetical protein